MHLNKVTRCLLPVVLLLAGVEHAQAQGVRNQLIHTGATSPGAFSVKRSAGVFTLRFVGDETIAYRVDTTDPSVTKGAIRIYESSSDCWPTRDGGMCFRSNAGACYFPASLAANTSLTGIHSSSDSVWLDYTLNFEGVHRMRTTYE